MRDSKKKSLIKTLSWRIISSIMGVGLVYFLTKQIAFSLTFGLIDMVIKSVAYYGHERMWTRT